MKKKALMACCNYWDSPFHVGSHHIAKNLLELGWQVGFVSDPISLLHVCKGLTDDLKKRSESFFSGGCWDESHNLYTWVPGAIVTPTNKFGLDGRWLHYNWHKLSVPNVINKIKQEGFGKVDLLYIDSKYQSFWLNKIQYRKSIFRVADKNDEFSSSAKITNEIENYIASKADCVVYSASTLSEYVSEMKPNDSFHLANGVNFNHFYYGDHDLPNDLKFVPAPRIIYVGAMAEWFDFECMIRIAKKMQDVSFVFIGDNESLNIEEKLPTNMFFLGKKTYRELPSYLHNSNVGIIPFNVEKYPGLVNNINPLKLYEYMSVGLPVVSTYWEELNNLKSPAYLYIRKALNEKTTLKEKYIKYARNNTWKSKVKNLVEYLSL